MIRFFETLLFEHNLFYVLAAAVICVLGMIATVNVYRWARHEEGTAWLDTA